MNPKTVGAMALTVAIIAGAGISITIAYLYNKIRSFNELQLTLQENAYYNGADDMAEAFKRIANDKSISDEKKVEQMKSLLAMYIVKPTYRSNLQQKMK